MYEPNPKKHKTNASARDTGPDIVPTGSADEDEQGVASTATTGTATPKDEWHYIDTAGKTQGPYSSELMKTWYGMGYFPPQTLVKITGKHADFVAVGTLGWVEEEGPAPQSLASRFEILTGQVSSLTGKVSVLEGRLDNITGAFGPATIYALMETAVYSSVDGSFDDSVKYGAAISCSLLLEVLASNDQSLLLEGGSGQFKKWKGPGKAKFPKENRLPVMVQGLHGLRLFVDKADLSEISGWSATDRNGLSHNGGFLDPIFTTPEKATSREDTTDYTTVKNQVKEKKAYYSDQGRTVESLGALKALDKIALEQKLKDKLGAVVAAFRGKGVSVDAACQVQVGNFLLSLGN